MPKEICRVCGNFIRVQIYKNSGICSQKCEKLAAKQNINSVSE